MWCIILKYKLFDHFFIIFLILIKFDINNHYGIKKYLMVEQLKVIFYIVINDIPFDKNYIRVILSLLYIVRSVDTKNLHH